MAANGVPEEVADAVRGAVQKHMGDIERAKRAALDAVRALDEFEAFVAGLVEAAVSGLVHEYRHRANVSLAAQMRASGSTVLGGAKVLVADSAAVGRVYRSVYEHAIGGRVLGDLTGADLLALADTEAARAAGHRFNAELAAWCARKVRGDQTVRQAIPEKELEKAYRKFKKAMQPAPQPAPAVAAAA